MIGKIPAAIDVGDITLLGLICFDVVDHQLLVSKLKMYNIDKNTSV